MRSGLTIAAGALALLAGSSASALTYSNGPLSTGPTSSNGTAAPAGTTWSEVQPPGTIAGFGAQGGTIGNRVADDFTVTDPAGWRISAIRLFGYQTGSSTTPTINNVNIRIWSGRPGDVGSTVVFGDTTTNRLTSASFASMYRIFNGSPGTTRPVMNLDAGGLMIDLAPGTYWVDWSATGSLASGPWAPQVTITGSPAAPGANGRQQTSTGWADALDGANVQAFPFVLTYELIPTPGAAALLGLAGLTGLRRRR